MKEEKALKWSDLPWVVLLVTILTILALAVVAPMLVHDPLGKGDIMMDIYAVSNSRTEFVGKCVDVPEMSMGDCGRVFDNLSR